MGKLTDYIQNAYAPTPSLTLESLARLIEEELDNPIALLREATASDTLTVSMIPEIPITELGWALLKTGDGDPVTPKQRSQLENFLKNIGGDDLQGRISNVTRFYHLDEDSAADLLGESSASTISKALSYLTFYKTLTTIITNFNASSAGFTFEAFLGVLLGGTQIPPGNNTIADLETGKRIDGPGGIAISLKLYNEKSVEVGGSYTDLVNDLVRRGYMQYVVVMKSLKETRKNDPLSVEGALHFYRFNFTVDNIFNILSKKTDEGGKTSLIQLPISFMQDTVAGDFDKGMPKKGAVGVQDLEDMFNAKVRAWDPQRADGVLEQVDWAKNLGLYIGTRGPGYEPFRKGRGEKFPIFAALTPLVRTEINPDGIIDADEQGDIAAMLFNFNAEIIDYRSKLDPERTAALGKLKFADTESSLLFYDSLSPELKKRALLNCRGYLYGDRFSLNRGDVYAIVERATGPGGDGGVLPSGQDKVSIGSINVGTSAVLRVLENVRGLINESVFDIFSNLKVLTLNIQDYFAEGLRDDDKAQTAIVAADNIESSTEDVRQQTKET